MKTIADPNYLNAVGLLFDIAGALLLAKSIFFNSVKSIASQVLPTWHDNANLRRALCEQRVDAWFGLPLLVVGFGIQLLCIFVVSETIHAIAVGIILIGALIAFYMGRDHLIKRLMLKSDPELLNSAEVAR